MNFWKIIKNAAFGFKDRAAEVGKQKSQFQYRKILHASARLYPDKILINTLDNIEMGLSIASSKISILKIDSENEEIGRSIRRHLRLTEFNLPNPSKDCKPVMVKFLTAAGFKNAKESYYRVKYVTISEWDGKITIYPSWNKGRNVFEGIKDTAIEIGTTVSDVDLGSQIRIAWELCEGGI
jgi:hypothetical protein